MLCIHDMLKTNCMQYCQCVRTVIEFRWWWPHWKVEPFGWHFRRISSMQCSLLVIQSVWNKRRRPTFSERLKTIVCVRTWRKDDNNRDKNTKVSYMTDYWSNVSATRLEKVSADVGDGLGSRKQDARTSQDEKGPLWLEWVEQSWRCSEFR